jgi:hypothetical protein
MIDAWAKVTDGRAIAAQLVGHEDAWQAPSLFQRMSVCVEGSPKPVFLAPDWNYDLVEVPFVGRNPASATDPGRYLRSEPLAPNKDAFIRDDHTPFGQQILDIAQAQRKMMAQVK